MTVEYCCIVKSIALDYQSPEQSQITDESDLRCLAVNVSVFWLHMCVDGGKCRTTKKARACVRREKKQKKR